MGKTGSKDQQEERHEMTPRTAILYARVFSREQREEGFSIEAQVKLLRAAASREGLEITREFIEVESAKAAGRKEFAEMVNYFKRNRSCRILLAEKTDRLYRNFRRCERWRHPAVAPLGAAAV
jgi:DNA invertase Pin-like site-specific DNA recombinase